MKRILIVDDNIEFLQLLSSILKQQFQVYETTGVQEAIKLLETITVDTICSDYYMRDGTGMELLQTLRRQGIKIPFMLMSASDDYHFTDEIQSWGASFCCKTACDFLDRIRDITLNVQVS